MSQGGYDLVHFDDLAYVASAHQEREYWSGTCWRRSLPKLAAWPRAATKLELYKILLGFSFNQAVTEKGKCFHSRDVRGSGTPSKRDTPHVSVIAQRFCSTVYHSD